MHQYPDKNEDLPEYFRSLEQNFPILLALLSKKARLICDKLNPEDFTSYVLLKQKILVEFFSSFESLLANFQSAVKYESESFCMYQHRLNSLLDQYLAARKIDSFAGLRDVILGEKLKSSFSKAMRTVIYTRGEDEKLTSSDLSRQADEIMAKSLLVDDYSINGGHVSMFGGGPRVQNSSGNSCVRKGQFYCQNCGWSSHSTDRCYKNRWDNNMRQQQHQQFQQVNTQNVKNNQSNRFGLSSSLNRSQAPGKPVAPLQYGQFRPNFTGYGTFLLSGNDKVL